MRLSVVFPFLIFTHREEVRLKNVAEQKYIGVTRGDNGFQLVTKTLQADDIMDPELIFSLYYFMNSDMEETKIVLPVHSSTKVCLSMDDNKILRLSSLAEDENSNEVIREEDPTSMRTADGRFFFLKSTGSGIALEAVNRQYRNQFLALSSNDEVTIKDLSDGGVYTNDMLFFLDNYNISNKIA